MQRVRLLLAEVIDAAERLVELTAERMRTAVAWETRKMRVGTPVRRGLRRAAALLGIVVVESSVLTGAAGADTDPRNEGSQPSASHNSAIIDNGTIALGINDEAHLNLGGGPPSSGSGTTVVGLRYLPTGAEATAPGCECEGWGAADATSGVTGFANLSTDGGVNNMRLVSFEALPADDPDRAVSVVDILGDDGETAVLEVTHDFHPSSTDFLYEATVTIRNVRSAPVEPRYRRVMDWDIEPTPFSEIVTIDGSPSENLLFSSNDGFASANPLDGPSDLAPQALIDTLRSRTASTSTRSLHSTRPRS